MDFFSAISYLHPFDAKDLRRYFDSLPHKLGFYLQSRIPKGSSVAVIFPKFLLKLTLPELKGHAVFHIFGDNIPGFDNVDSLDGCDFVLAEPLGFSDHGYIVPHGESKLWGNNVIACCSLAQKTGMIPAECDLVVGSQLVCEKGIINFENLCFTPNL